ncbi:NifU family protein [Candidatus Uhrbacteria bacterium]|nr:NifU family protein [Candidatus Uhrbacteria bacterium]
METKPEQFYSQVEQILDEIREPMILHGGNVELVSADPESGLVEVRLHGACVGCPMAEITLKGGIEATLMEKIPQVKEVRAVE